MYAIICTAVIALLVGLDQLTKYIVVSNMTLNQTVHAIDGLLDWTYILNDGASFGMLGGMRWFLIVFTALVMGFIAYVLYTRRFRHPLGTTSLVLVLSGGIGNLIDRVLNHGLVIDFIDIDPIFSFPKFNVADCCVTCGAVLLCVYILFFFEEKKKKTAERTPTEKAADGE